jgi:Uma2 family endonuclease
MTAPIGVLMPGCDPVQPDIVVVRRDRRHLFRDRRIHGAPNLIVEILSPSTSAYDVDVKAATYAGAEVAEYVIVDPAARAVRHLRLVVPGQYETVAVAGGAETITFDCLPTLPLIVADLFAGAPDDTL